MKLNSILILVVSLLIMSCDSKRAKSDLSAEKDTLETSQKQFAGLPVLFDSTEVLIHPVGVSESYGSRSFFSSESDYYQHRSSMSHTGSNSIEGTMTNLVFQHIHSEKMTPLTDQNWKIHSVVFLDEFYRKTGKQLLIYRISDRDNNQDDKIDQDDLVSLYSSRLDGTQLIKLTKDDEQLDEYKIIAAMDRLYIRTVSDSDENGKFDHRDKFHFYYQELQEALKPIEYRPFSLD